MLIQITYPEDFPARSRAKVELALEQAEVDFGERNIPNPAVVHLSPAEVARRHLDLEGRTKQLAATVSFVFAEEACNLGRQGRWSLERIRTATEDFLHQMAVHAYYGKGISRSGGLEAFESELRVEIENSEQWKEYRQRRLTIGAQLIERPGCVAGTETGINSPEGGAGQPSILEITAPAALAGGAIVAAPDARAAQVPVVDPHEEARAKVPASDATSGPVPKMKKRRAPGPDSAREQGATNPAARRQAVVLPILQRKRWKRGRLVTESGVGKATVYGYLNGTRTWIDQDNRKAIADALDLELEQLPD